MKRLLLLLALMGCSKEGDWAKLRVTEVKQVSIVSPDGIPSEEMVMPPDDTRENCNAVYWSICEAAMPGVVRIKRAYVVQRGPDGVPEWSACSNVICVKASE